MLEGRFSASSTTADALLVPATERVVLRYSPTKMRPRSNTMTTTHQHHQHNGNQHHNHHNLFSLGQLVTAMAGAASLASLITAILGSRVLAPTTLATTSNLVLATHQTVPHLQQQQLRTSHSSLRSSSAPPPPPPPQRGAHESAREFLNRVVSSTASPPPQVSSPYTNRIVNDHASADKENDDGDAVWPKIAWLMSFPNSGTSYTLHMLRESSNTTTATNYALEGEIKDRPSLPIHPTMADTGPWLELLANRSTSIPRRYIVTKTHCGGFCNHCPFQRFLETPRSFQTACRTGTKALFPSLLPPAAVAKNSSTTSTATATTTDPTKGPSKSLQPISPLPPRKRRVTYDIVNVKKAIHLIRNPLENIVARFHLDFYRQERLTNFTFSKTFPNTATGFQKWCAYYDDNNDNETENANLDNSMDNNNNKTVQNANAAASNRNKKNRKQQSTWDKDEKNRWVDRELQDAMIGVPCRGEFYRYVQWHNYAFEMTRDMGIPALTVHYEDYYDDVDHRTTSSNAGGSSPPSSSLLSSRITRNNILDFLELEPKGGGDKNGLEFIAGKEYSDFYSDSQKKAVWKFIREFSSRETWTELQQYNSM